MRSFRVLPQGYGEALPNGRDRHGSSHFLPPTLRGERQENSPHRRLAGNLDPDPLPLLAPAPLSSKMIQRTIDLPPVRALLALRPNTLPPLPPTPDSQRPPSKRLPLCLPV